MLIGDGKLEDFRRRTGKLESLRANSDGGYEFVATDEHAVLRMLVHGCWVEKGVRY